MLRAAGALAAFAVPAGRAAALVLTPAQTRGPFYPLSLPLDDDADLVRVRGRAGIAQGTITHVGGRVVDERDRPLAGARVEIWQCDANGRYHHPRDRRDAPEDPNFQGYGSTPTAADGGYRFRTIRPVPYGFRTPHIHFAVRGPGFEPLVTQLYVAGEPRNARDGVLNRIADPRRRASVIVPFELHPEEPGELIARFDIVVAADGRSG